MQDSSSDEESPFRNERGSRFLGGEGTSSEGSDLESPVGRQPGGRFRPGEDDVRPNMDPRVSVDPRPISGPIATPEDLKAIFEGEARRKKDKKKDRRQRPPGARYDDVRPKKRDNDPDPDHLPGNNRLNDY